jgi:mannitol-specific phosphotransferase system IIBC component
VNWIAIILGAVFSMLLGFLWYGPLFGKLWLRSIGKKAEELESRAGMYVIAFVAALVTAYVLAVLIGGLGVTVWWWGALVGAAVSIGIGAAAALINGLFLREPFGSWLLFAFYQLVLYAVEGLVFAVWKL